MDLPIALTASLRCGLALAESSRLMVVLAVKRPRGAGSSTLLLCGLQKHLLQLSLIVVQRRREAPSRKLLRLLLSSLLGVLLQSRLCVGLHFPCRPDDLEDRRSRVWNLLIQAALSLLPPQPLLKEKEMRFFLVAPQFILLVVAKLKLKTPPHLSVSLLTLTTCIIFKLQQQQKSKHQR